MRNIKNKLSIVLAALLLVSCVVGSLAYFTDRVSTQAKVSTMDNAIDIVPEPDPEAEPDDPNKDPDDYTDPTPKDPTDDLTNWWLYLNSIANVNFNPGDKMDLSYILVNKGGLDVKIRETFVITSSKPMTFSAAEQGEEFLLCTAYSNVPTGGVGASAFTGMTFDKISDTQYKVMIEDSELAVSASCGKNYYLVFAPTAGNGWQKATCTISYVVEAMQADGDWGTVATGELVLNGHSFNVVPEA